MFVCIQQNSFNLTRMGLDNSWMVKYSGLLGGMNSDIRFTRGCGYCSYTWALQLIWGVFHLDMSFISWFIIISVFFCVFWSCHTWRSWCSRRQEVRGYRNVWFKGTLGGFLNMSQNWKVYISGEMYNFQFWYYSPEVPDCPEFLLIWCWIKAIFVVLLVCPFMIY